MIVVPKNITVLYIIAITYKFLKLTIGVLIIRVIVSLKNSINECIIYCYEQRNIRRLFEHLNKRKLIFHYSILFIIIFVRYKTRIKMVSSKYTLMMIFIAACQIYEITGNLNWLNLGIFR